MSIRNLFYWSYWFSQPYIARGTVFTAWLWAFLLLVLAGLVAKILSQYQKFEPQRKFFGRIASLGLTMGLTGLVWFGLRQQRIPFLAWRVWLLLWVVVFVVWAWKILVYAVKRMPTIKREQAQRLQREKYLPKQ